MWVVLDAWSVVIKTDSKISKKKEIKKGERRRRREREKEEKLKCICQLDSRADRVSKV